MLAKSLKTMKNTQNIKNTYTKYSSVKLDQTQYIVAKIEKEFYKEDYAVITTYFQREPIRYEEAIGAVRIIAESGMFGDKHGYSRFARESCCEPLVSYADILHISGSAILAERISQSEIVTPTETSQLPLPIEEGVISD